MRIRTSYALRNIKDLQQCCSFGIRSTILQMNILCRRLFRALIPLLFFFCFKIDNVLSLRRAWVLNSSAIEVNDWFLPFSKPVIRPSASALYFHIYLCFFFGMKDGRGSYFDGQVPRTSSFIFQCCAVLLLSLAPQQYSVHVRQKKSFLLPVSKCYPLWTSQVRGILRKPSFLLLYFWTEPK